MKLHSDDEARLNYEKLMTVIRDQFTTERQVVLVDSFFTCQPLLRNILVTQALYV